MYKLHSSPSPVWNHRQFESTKIHLFDMIGFVKLLRNGLRVDSSLA